MKKLLTSVICTAILSFSFGSEAYAVNLLQNPNFETVGSYGSFTTLTSSFPAWAPGYSAAESWTVWNNTAATTTTELVVSTFDANNMLHVTTSGKDNGIVQVFGLLNTGPTNVLSSVWVYVLSGQIAIGTGNGGNTWYDSYSSGNGYWEMLQSYNGVSPANEFIIYASSFGGADFYVDVAAITPVSSVPEPSTVLLLGSGIIGLGYIRKRYSGHGDDSYARKRTTAT